MTHRARVLAPLLSCVGMLLPCSARGQTQTPAQSRATTSPTVQWNVSNLTRVESWRFFDPPPTGGNPDYTFAANRLRLRGTARWSRVDAEASVQYVQFGNLPEGALGPGPLGTGALYYAHSGRTDSRGAYLRTVFGRLHLPKNVTIQVGRFPYSSGGESPSGEPKIEAVKRARIDARLIGEFEWSLFQRTFDGVRGDFDRKQWHASGSWFTPTQGGFEDVAGGRMTGVKVGAASFALRPSVVVRSTEIGAFLTTYHDTRQVTGRPDNTGLTAARADVAITTLGATAVGARAAGNGEADWLVWFAGQTGSWYSQDHRAWSLALEGGYQWKTSWQPWMRAGFLHASGDADPADNRHGTFFPMLPTVRKYALTTAYAPMNLDDSFVEVATRPMPRLTARIDVRRLWLAEAADLWYSGSGATQQRGAIFGYAGRRSGGSTNFGTVIEGAADVSLGRHWSLNGFVGGVRGAEVVKASFDGNWLRFLYLENVIQF